MLQSHQTLDDTSERLARIHKTSLQNEEIGHDIKDALAEDREVLERARRKVRSVNENIDSSRRILSGMAVRLVTNKIILCVIILIELLGIALIVYVKWIHKLIFK